MKRVLILCVVCLCAFASIANAKKPSLPGDKIFSSLLAKNESLLAKKWADSIYLKIRLDTLGLNEDVFFYACKGYQYFLSKNMLSNKNILSICDFSQSSKEKRLYVIDMEKGKVLHNTYVSHGAKSGSEYATSFSNSEQSHKSSQGFMITAETYKGKAGYSMRFDGQEPGINDNVRSRSVVMHGSWYVNPQRAREDQAMGRSYGCPAVSYELHNQIINDIKDGSCFFVYTPDFYYAKRSQIMNAKFEWPAFKN